MAIIKIREVYVNNYRRELKRSILIKKIELSFIILGVISNPVVAIYLSFLIITK